MKHLLVIFLAFGLIACNDDEATIDIKEAGQQVGGLMSALDETGGDDGDVSFTNQIKNEEDLLLEKTKAPASSISISKLFTNNAFAAECSIENTFSTCSSNQITRNFNGCAVGDLTFTGSVDFTFNDDANLCLVNDIGESISRAPNFTISGARGGELVVSQTGSNGQVLERTAADAFEFSNDGIRRVISVAGLTIYDFTTQTTAPIGVSGTNRSNRQLNGGSFAVTNNRTGRTCTVQPNNVTWTSDCTCATSGSWTGTCTDESTFILNITGCGSANLNLGGESEDFTFYRCESI